MLIMYKLLFLQLKAWFLKCIFKLVNWLLSKNLPRRLCRQIVLYFK